LANNHVMDREIRNRRLVELISSLTVYFIYVTKKKISNLIRILIIFIYFKNIFDILLSMGKYIVIDVHSIRSEKLKIKVLTNKKKKKKK
jgi:hypothetical protein